MLSCTAYQSKSFGSFQLYVRAMDYDRTLVSARANMGGLYPPVQVGPGKQNLTWQDVSVHTILALRDAVSLFPWALQSDYSEGRF